MKRFFVFLLSAVLFASAFNVCNAAEELHFYVKRGKNHIPPTTDERFLSAFDENSYYLDNKAAESGEKKLYLTFDAGYENGNVAKILDVLKEENVPAAFFVLSHFVRTAPELVTRMLEEGHLVCNHTKNHKNLSSASEEEIRRNLTALEKIYEEKTGREMSKYFRFPEGCYSIESLKSIQKLGYKTVFGV